MVEIHFSKWIYVNEVLPRVSVFTFKMRGTTNFQKCWWGVSYRLFSENLLSNIHKVWGWGFFLNILYTSYMIGISIEHWYGDKFKLLKVLINIVANIGIWLLIAFFKNRFVDPRSWWCLFSGMVKESSSSMGKTMFHHTTPRDVCRLENLPKWVILYLYIQTELLLCF